MGGGNLSLFLLAAVIIAAIPGPGIFYVAARTLSGGKKAGIASTLGTALGGLAHVVAGGLGVSAIILASAQLFTGLKLAGALYLIWLGIRTIREAGNLPPEQTGPIGAKRAFRASWSRRSIPRPRLSSWRSFRNFWSRELATRRCSS
jgi:threonine/homoserine/homoserine lactone efflux protein